MMKNLNLSNLLDFSEIDLTAPDKVVKEILEQLPEDTQGIIFGSVVPYDGPVTSYTTTRTSIAEAIGTLKIEKHVNIQDKLGKNGEENNKYECFLYTSSYEKYKYRMFFMKYGIVGYPVQFTLDEGIARSIQGDDFNYIITCNNREEVEELLANILTSKKILAVMQELIRIYQAKKCGEIVEELENPADTE